MIFHNLLICFSCSVDDGEVDGCKFAYFAPRSVATEAQLKLSFAKVTPDTMIWMQKRLGVAFPFLKYRYFQVVAPEYPSAMENITQTTWNTMFLLDDVWALEYKHWVDLINCHEMAHSYFGDSVTIRHFDHAWLKESWADYMESCWLEHFRGKDEFEYNLHLCSELYFSECGGYQRPIATKRYNSSWQMYDNHLYPGGARRIHMLRRLLGEETFWAAIRDYLGTYNWENAKKNKAIGVASATVETDLFRMILEKHSGFNLTPFFDRTPQEFSAPLHETKLSLHLIIEWIHGRGYPRLQYVSSSFHPARSLHQLLTFVSYAEER
jgi:aminopeptidase N